MQDTALRELDDAAPPAFVNGSGARDHGPARMQGRPSRRTVRPGVAPQPPAEAAAPTPAFAVPDALGPWLRLHEDWRARMTAVAETQLAIATEAGGALLAAGRILAAEADPARRLELIWNEGLRQFGHSVEASSRLFEAWTGQARSVGHARAD